MSGFVGFRGRYGSCGGKRSAAPEHLVGGVDPQLLENVDLGQRPGYQAVEAGGVEPGVALSQRPEGAPPRRLSLDTQPKGLQLDDAAQRCAVEEMAVERTT